LRAHAEISYNRSGWPAEPGAWEPIERERDAVAGADDLRTGERYGLTYGATRWSDGYMVRRWSDRGKGCADAMDKVPRILLPIRGMMPNGAPVGFWTSWMALYFNDRVPENHMFQALLSRNEYAEKLKEEIRTAFADFQ